MQRRSHILIPIYALALAMMGYLMAMKVFKADPNINIAITEIVVPFLYMIVLFVIGVSLSKPSKLNPSLMHVTISLLCVGLVGLSHLEASTSTGAFFINVAASLVLVVCFISWMNKELRVLYNLLHDHKGLAWIALGTSQVQYIIFIVIPVALLGFSWQLDLLFSTYTLWMFAIIGCIHQLGQVQHRLFTIKQWLHYSLFSLLPIVAGGILCALVFGNKLKLQDYGIMMIIAYGLCILCPFLKDKLERDRRLIFLSITPNYSEALSQFGNALVKVEHLHQLESMLVKEICSVFMNSEVAIVQYDDKKETTTIRAGSITMTEIEMQRWLQFELTNHDLTILKDYQFLQLYSYADRHLFLIMGTNQGTKKLHAPEVQYIKTICLYVSIAYEKLLLIEGLVEQMEQVLSHNSKSSPKLVQLVFNISEQERRKLSLELHDTALQTQLVWHRSLQGVLSDWNDLPEQVAAELTKIGEGMLDVIYQIRETCTDLRPFITQGQGIIEPLQELIRLFQLRENFVIHFDGSHFSHELPLDDLITMYRIIQELLNNTSKHASASWVEIVLNSSAEEITLSYQDDGLGMDLEEWSSSSQHIGLTGIMERAYGLGGEVRFRSKPGQGFFCELVYHVSER